MNSTYAITIIIILVIQTCHGQSTAKCTDPDTILMNGQCQKVNCRIDAQCKPYQSYCTTYSLGQMICLGEGQICGCDNSHPGNDDSSCNRNLNGNDKCTNGQVCFPNGLCGPPPSCSFFGDPCHPENHPCCDSDVFFCSSSTLKCARTALAQESCSSDIPCESGSSCINNTCSFRKGDGCGFNAAVCPPETKCINKKCI